MMTKTSDFLGVNGGVATKLSYDGIGDVFPISSVAGTSAFYHNNSSGALEGIQVAGTSSSIGESTTFTPLNDTELRRRARNNAILAKIQELEANASVQAARSERLRMMREEYEALVRKYASNRKWNWNQGQGSHTNGFLNGSNGHYQYSYLSRNGTSSHQPPNHNASYNASGPQLTQTRENEEDSPRPPFTHPHHPTRDIPSNINGSFATTGVNTDITGPVRPILEEVIWREKASGVKNDTEGAIHNVEGKRVKVIVDVESQTEDNEMGSHFMEVIPHSKGLQASSSSGTFIYDGRFKKPNQKCIGESDEDEKSEPFSKSTLIRNENLSKKLEMMMLLEDEEDDEESLLEKRERKRKLQLQEFHQQPQANSSRILDDGISLIASELEDDDCTESTAHQANADNENLPTSSNTTDEGLLKLRHRQKQQSMKEKGKSSVKRLEELMYQKKRNRQNEEEDSFDTTLSFANNRKGAGGGGGGLTDISYSDSTSVHHLKLEAERKKLLEQLAPSYSSKTEVKFKGKKRAGAESENESSSDDEQEKSVIRTRMTRKSALDENEEPDEPTTTAGGGGATSESIGDSLMDSAQKTPDTLPKDKESDDDDANSELKGKEILEAIKKENEKRAEIKSSHKLASGDSPHSDNEADDDVLVVTATAATNKAPERESGELILNQSSVNDSVLKATEIGLKRSTTEEEFVEQSYHKKTINDAEDIRSNNLSSKIDVPAEQVVDVEEEGGRDANYVNTKDTPRATGEDGEAYDVEQSRIKKDEEKEFSKSESRKEEEATEWKEKDMALHSRAPSASMSANSSSSSSFTSSGCNGTTGGVRNASEIPEKQVARNDFQRGSSTESSFSGSSSRQHSVDEQRKVKETLKEEESESRVLPSQNNLQENLPSTRVEHLQSTTSTLPKSLHKRHQQLEEQVKKEHDEKDTSPPVGAKILSEQERHPTSPLSTKSLPNDDSTKVSVDNGGRVGKSTETFHQVTTNSSSSSSQSPSKQSGIRNSGNSSGKGNGMTGGVNNVRSGTTTTSRSVKSSSGIPPKQLAPTTVHKGPLGAMNTARRVRLKLNYDDSESDSSEIGLGKGYTSTTSGTGNVAGNQMNTAASAAQKLDSTFSINDDKNNKAEEKVSSRKPDEDDEFDDFFDI